MSSTGSILRASFVVIALSVANKITGYIKLVLTTAAFGTNAGSDALAAASQIPDVFFMLIAGGAIANAVIPVYSEILLQGEDKTRFRFLSSLFTVILTVSILTCVLLIYIAPWMTRTILVPNFTPEQQELTAQLMRINLFSLTVFGVASICTNLLHAHKHFFFPALAAVFLDSGYIIGVYFWADTLGEVSLAWGGLLGVLMYLLLLVPPIWRYRIIFRPGVDFSMPEVREVFRLILPRLLVLGSAEIVDVVNVNLSSGLNEGSLSAFFFALLLINMPVSLFGHTFLITFFPSLSDSFNLDDLKGLHRGVVNGMLQILFWLVPSFAGLIALGRPGIAFLMQRGEFTAESTAMVYSLLTIAALGAVAQSVMNLAAMLFFARHNTIIPMWFEIGSMLFAILLSFVLVSPFGISGIAWARSTAAFVTLVSLLVFYQMLYGGLDLSKFYIGLSRVLGASAAMMGLIWVIRQFGLSGLMYIAGRNSKRCGCLRFGSLHVGRA